MLRLALRNLRARAARTTFTAAAIALGVGLIFAMRLTGATLTESARAARESRLAGADLEITSAASAQIPLSILDTLTARPEIESAAPLYRGLEGKAAAGDGTFTMGGGTLEGTGLALLGVDPAHTLTPYELAAGRFLQAEDAAAVLLPSDWAARHGHAVGGRIKLTTGARTDTYAIVGLLKPRREVVVATATAWLPLTTLSAAFDAPQTVTAIQIRLRPDQNSEAARAALQAGLGDQYIVTSAAGSSSLNSLYSVINLALPVAGFAVLLAGAFLVFNAFAITLAERRREIGQLRTLGMTRRQVLTQALLEAGLVGVFGSALGLLLGLGFGIGMVAIVSAINGYDSAAGAVIPWDAWPLAAGAGVLVTVVVTVGLAREAAQVSALEAFKPPFGSASKRRGRRAWLAGLVVVLLAATAGLYLWGAEYARTALTPSYGPIFAPALTFGAAVVALLPLWLDGLITLLERGQWLAGRLAAASLRRQGSRAAVTAATLTTSFMLVIALTGLTLFMSQFLLSFNLSMFSGQVVLIRPFPPGTSLGGAAALPSLPPLPADLEADLGTLEDVAEVQYFANVAIPGVGVESGAGDQYAFALPLSVIRGKRTFPIAEGSWEDAERIFVEQEPAILLPELTGRKFDKHPGDTIEIDTLKGKVPFTVAAVGGGFPIISPAAAAEYFGSHPFGIIFSPKPGVARAALEARVDALRERHRTELGAFNTEQLTATVETLIGPIQALFGGLTSLSGLVAALGIVVTLFASVLERQREIGTLRALGLRRDEVRGLVVLEAGLLGFAGAGLGALGGLGLAALFSQGMNTAMEAVAGMRPVEGLPVPWELALASFFIGPAIAMLAALWPAGRAADVDPAVAMRAEGATGFAPPAAKRPAHPRRRALPRSLSLTLALRSLDQQRTRTYLSLTAIALGACMTVAGDMLSQSIIGVVTRTEDLRAIGQGLWSQLDPAFKGIGAGIMLAAGFLIFNTFAMSVTQRRQQIGALRALGMTRGQVLRMVLTEALLVGGAGTVLGVLLGPLVGRGLIALMRSLQNSLLNVFVSAEPSPLSYGLAIALGLGITLLASLVPARAATRLSPLVALKTPEQSGLDRSPRRLGAAGLSLGLALMVWLAVSPPALWLPPPWEVITTLGVAAVWLLSLALLLPAAVGALGASLRPALARVGGAPGRLMADNLRRGRGRVLVTVATLALSLTMIGGLTGFIQFYLFEQFGPKMEELRRQNAWIIMQMDITSGLAGYANLESLRTPPEAQAELRALLGDRADLMPFGFVIVPELSFMGDAYFSFMLDPDLLARSGSLFMTFKEGAWDSALPIMRAGCGLLVTPGIAAENRVGLGQTLSVHGPRGPVTCTIAGIGSTFVGASIISQAAADQFDPGAPFSLFVQSRPGTDAQQLDADLTAAAGRLDLHLLRMDQYLGLMLTVFENVPLFFNAFLLLAVLAAGLGVINTTLLSVTERRREFGQLRALGATRRQVRVIIIGEAALMGLLGGVIGLAASAGLTIIFATVYGGVSAGVENYQPWAAVGRTLPKVLTSGWVGLVAAPLICALAAYFPAQAVVRGTALDTLQPEQPLTARRVAGWLGRGSLQTRFVLSTAALLAAVLGVLVPVIVQHAGDYLRVQTRTMLGALVDWNAAALESALPRNAQRLDLNALSGGLPGGGTFDAAGLLRFQSLLDSFGENGIEQYALTTPDNVVLLGLKPEQIGETLPALDERELTHVTEAAADDGTPLLTAVAPIRSPAGVVLGHVRLTLRFDALRQFLESLQRLLWLAGGLIVLIGLGLGYAVITPLARTARALAAQTARISQGDYRPLEFRAGRVSLRTRLTILMTLLVAGLVGGLGLIVIPIERQEVERTLKDSVLASTRWFADSFSEAAGAAVTPTLTAAPDLSALMGQLGGRPGADQPAGLDAGRLQDILARFRGDLVAYTAWVDLAGRIALADQLSLQGEPGVTAAEARIADGRWREEAIWVAAAPLRRGRDGEQLGTLNLGLRRSGVEAFLAESRTLFGLIGLSALLASVLLAQVLGTAVAAPVEQLVSGARRVAAGDLSGRFQAGAGDELAQLAGAFNAMVAGLRERERLRDLFGRFLSREVSEAVLAGRVSLAGERKTITALFVDMRGSTAFAEQFPPETVLAALNQYFEVIILAVEAHGGIVNRFVGDEAVCVFGAPAALPDHAERAVQAALSIREGLRYVNAKRAGLGQPELRFGLGVNTGEVVAGATGSEERQEYTLIGDAMNLGARLQALTKTFPDHDLVLSEFTAAALNGSHRLVDLGEAEIRGKSRPVRIYGIAAGGQGLGD